MPILDIQVKVENNKIIYKFYKKPVSSPLLMLERSAMPTRIKRNNLAEEGLWRLRNTKRDLAWEIKADILSEFSFSMMLSSYSEKVRCEIIQSVLTGTSASVTGQTEGSLPSTDPETTTKRRGGRRNSWPSPPGIGPRTTLGSSLVLRVENWPNLS